MKKTLSAVCLLAAMPCLFGAAMANATTVPDDAAPDSSFASTLPGGPDGSTDRHVPLNGVPTTSSAANEHQFRYMDMVAVKRVKSLRRAVIVIGNDRQRSSCTPAYRHNMSDVAPQIRRPSQQGRAVVVMRPMT